MLTLCVTTPKDHTLVHANLDIQAMENHAQVNALIIFRQEFAGNGGVRAACKSKSNTADVEGGGEGEGWGFRSRFTENNSNLTYAPASHHLSRHFSLGLQDRISRQIKNSILISRATELSKNMTHGYIAKHLFHEEEIGHFALHAF